MTSRRRSEIRRPHIRRPARAQTWHRALLFAAVTVGVACGVDPSAELDASPADDVEMAADASVPEPDGGIQAPQCSVPGYAIGHLRGRVIDTQGTPLSGIHVNVCGSLCLTALSDVSGRFDIAVNECMAESPDYAHGAVFSALSNPTRPDLFYDYNFAGTRSFAILDITAPIVLPSFTSGRFIAAPSASATAVTLTDGAGFSLRVPPRAVDYPLTVTDEVLRVVRVAADRFPPLATGGAAPAVLYAVGPMDTGLRELATLELPNVTSSAPGTRVEIVAVGTHASANTPPIGVLARIDDGHVSSDGRRITADHGIRFISWVGYRLPR